MITKHNRVVVAALFFSLCFGCSEGGEAGALDGSGHADATLDAGGAASREGGAEPADASTEQTPRCIDGVLTGDYRISSAADLERLAGCTTVTGKLLILGTELTNLQGLQSIRSVGNLDIRGNLKLADLRGLENLETIEGTFIILGAALEDLDGLQNLTSVGDWVGIGGVELLSLHGLEGLKRIGGSLIINEAYKLESLAGLSGLESIGGDLMIENTALKESDGLNALKTVGGGFYLAPCWGGGEEWIACIGNFHLTLINGFESLQSVGGDLYIAADPFLERVDGFGELTEIGGSLVLMGDRLLREVKGFEKLVSVEAIYAVGVPLLTDIPALFGAAKAVEKHETVNWDSDAEARPDCLAVDCATYTLDMRRYLDPAYYPGNGDEDYLCMLGSWPKEGSGCLQSYKVGYDEAWEDRFGDITGYVEGYKVEIRDARIGYTNFWSPFGIHTTVFGNLSQVDMVYDPADELELYATMKRTWWELEPLGQ